MVTSEASEPEPRCLACARSLRLPAEHDCQSGWRHASPFTEEERAELRRWFAEHYDKEGRLRGGN